MTFSSNHTQDIKKARQWQIEMRKVDESDTVPICKNRGRPEVQEAETYEWDQHSIYIKAPETKSGMTAEHPFCGTI